MARPDTRNAHIRSQPDSSTPDQIADGFERVLNDPAFDQAFELLEEELVQAIASLACDGSDAMLDFEHELCMTLRNLRSVKALLINTVQHRNSRQQIRDSLSPGKLN
jgi:hypothetical protein